MGVVVPLVVISVFAVALYTRAYGSIDMPGTSIHLWNVIMVTSPQLNLLNIIMQNMLLFTILYSFAYILLYVEPGSSLFFPLKFNPKYPKNSLIIREVYRSYRGILICSIMEYITNILHNYNIFPIQGDNEFIKTYFNSQDIGFPLLVLLFGIVYLWGDMHFYWTHRMLHTKWFYKSVHKEHHESYNPDPWSGLSMHWFESAVYFSSAFLLSPFVPLWISSLLYKGLIIFPLEGHSGYGSWNMEGSHNHYIHHAKFNWNYGSSPLWDHLMGTNYSDKNSNRQTEKEAYRQAALVGCQISKGIKNETKEKIN